MKLSHGQCSGGRHTPHAAQCPHLLEGSYSVSRSTAPALSPAASSGCHWCVCHDVTGGESQPLLGSGATAATPGVELWHCLFAGCDRVCCGAEGRHHWRSHWADTRGLHCVARSAQSGRVWCESCQVWTDGGLAAAGTDRETAPSSDATTETAAQTATDSVSLHANEPDCVRHSSSSSSGGSGSSGSGSGSSSGGSGSSSGDETGSEDESGASSTDAECATYPDNAVLSVLAHRQSCADHCDQTSAASCSRAEQRESGRPGLAGLLNLGNTCYLNAILQALAHLPCFVDNFVHAPPPAAARLAASLSQLLRRLWRPDGPDCVAPYDVLSALAVHHRQFSSRRQHDSQEVLRCLLAALHEELRHPRPATLPPQQQSAGASSQSRFAPDCGDHTSAADSSSRVTLPQDEAAKAGSPTECGRLCQSSDAAGYPEGADNDDDLFYEASDQPFSDSSSTPPAASAASGVTADTRVVCQVGERVQSATEESCRGEGDARLTAVPPTPQQQQCERAAVCFGTSLVSDVFDGELESCVKCLSCHTVSTSRETFQDLSLPIPSSTGVAVRPRGPAPSSPPDCSAQGAAAAAEQTVVAAAAAAVETASSWLDWTWSWLSSWWLPDSLRQCLGGFWGPGVSLYDCLDWYFAPELLQHDNMYRCERCRSLRPGLKYCRVSRLPEALTLHLKRFRYDTFASATKLSTRVTFPLASLQLADYVSEGGRQLSPCYDLCAVVCHSGAASGGHYTSVALHAPSRHWYQFDDCFVTNISPTSVSSCQPYVLFYRKRSECAELRRERANQLTMHPRSSPLATRKGDACYVSRRWLCRFNTLCEPGPVDNSDFSCRHGARRPDLTVAAARAACLPVPPALWQYWTERGGGGPLVRSLRRCSVCRSVGRRRGRDLSICLRHRWPGGGQHAEGKCGGFVVSRQWLRLWRQFLQDETGWSEPPGPIDNTLIAQTLVDNGTSQLKCDRECVVPPHLWRYLQSVYGGGPAVPFYCLNFNSEVTPCPVPSPSSLEKTVVSPDVTSVQVTSNHVSSHPAAAEEVTEEVTGDVIGDVIGDGVCCHQRPGCDTLDHSRVVTDVRH